MEPYVFDFLMSMFLCLTLLALAVLYVLRGVRGRRGRVNHFANLGFLLNTRSDFDRVLRLVLDDGLEVRAAKGWSYYCLRLPEGPELWAEIDADRKLRSLNPFFRGQSQSRVVVSDLNPPIAAEAMVAWAGERQNDNPGQFPLAFDPPARLLAPGREPPFAASVRLAAFAESIAIYRDPDVFHASQGGRLNLAARSFLPVGLFPGPRQGAYARFTGTVREARRMTNSATGRSFYWMLIETLEPLRLDVVARDDALAAAPAAGNVVDISCWLTGKIESVGGA